jgi:DNA-3-methyladenine glycosylase II
VSAPSVFLLDDSDLRRSMQRLYDQQPSLETFCPEPLSRIKRERVSNESHALIKILIGQQISTSAANATWKRFLDRLGDDFTVHDITGFDRSELQSFGLSHRKAEYLYGLIHAIDGGALELAALKAMPKDTLYKALTHIKGFGVWSADMFALFTLMRMDIWPHLDLGVRYGFEIFQGAPKGSIPAEECAALGPHLFGENLSVAALCMWDIKANHRHIDC